MTVIKTVLSVQEAAEVLRLSRNSCYEAIRRGEIPSLRIGKRILIPRVALEKMLQEPNTTGSAVPRK